MTHQSPRHFLPLQKNIHVVGTAMAVLLAALLATESAQASTVGGALLFGNGFNDGYRIGVGARGGVTVPSGVYIGAAFMMHEGLTGWRHERGERPQTDVYYGGAEGGWDFAFDPLIIRPYLGLGYGLVHSSATSECSAREGCVSASSNDGAFALFPGVAGLVKVGIVVFGADFRYVLLAGSGYENAVGAFGTAGLSF
ncbi:MAG TPA: hypothetical protein VK540_22985 [Polyangiaceae bacterium]|nr:hypothetical protein [Polyangiaceae bacterium]